MKTAHNLIKKLGLSLSEALVKAWKAIKFKERLKQGIEVFEFLKKDGSIRKAIGTLDLALFEYEAKGSTKENYSSIAYWDIEAEGFRAFSVENLV